MKKFYTENQIYVATFLGGPVPAGILIYQNLKQTGDHRGASGALLLTLVFTFLLFFGIMQIPPDLLERIPNLLFTTLYTVVVFFVYRRFLVDRIHAHFTEEKQKASNWRVAGFTLVGLCINIAIILGIALAQPPFEGEKMEFGPMKHQVYYDEESIDAYTVSSVGEVLVNHDFFGDEYQKAVRLEEEGDLLLLTLDVQRQFWDDQEFLDELQGLKDALQTTLRREVGIEMIHYSLDGEDTRKRI